MKYNFDLIKDIMNYVETSSNGRCEVWVMPKYFSVGYDQDEIDYHLNILGDDNLLILGDYGGVSGSLPVYRLTAEGHRVLEVITNDTLWRKIKINLLSGGRDELKKIPSIAIKLILTGVV